MYAKHFRIEESPFSAAPDPRYLYMSRKHREALAHLHYGVSAAGGFVLLTGEVGTGKTTLCRCLVDQLPENVDLALCFNPRLSEVELLAHICDDLGVPCTLPHSLKTLVDCLNSHLLAAHALGRTTVLVIDEAQDLSPEVLEQVRLLTNLETEKKKLLQIILIGQPEFDEMLASRDFRQLAQRITARWYLEPLDADETGEMIHHRLLVGGLSSELFTPPALREVHRVSQGIPRLINSICDRALLAAYARDVDRIDWRLVRVAAAEVLTRSARSWGSTAWISMSPAAVAGFAAALLLFHAADAAISWSSTSFANLASLTQRAAKTLLAEEPVPAAAALADVQTHGPPAGAARAPPSGSDAARDISQPAEVDPQAAPRAKPWLSSSITPHPGPESAVATEGTVEQGSRDVTIPSEAIDAREHPTEIARRSGLDEAPAAVVRSRQEPLAGANGVGEAARDLAALWGLDPGDLADQGLCPRATPEGLECFKGRGTWDTLRALNRPALIWLTTPEGRHVETLVTALTDSQAHLNVGGETLLADLADVTPHWTGEYLILWKRPDPLPGILSIGMRGPGVAWLRDRLAGSPGEATETLDEGVFDDGLRDQVLSFQQSRGLAVDGVVGPRTLVHLVGAYPEDGEPVLAPRTSAPGSTGDVGYP